MELVPEGFLRDLPHDPQEALIELVERYKQIPQHDDLDEILVRVIYRLCPRIGIKQEYREDLDYRKNFERLELISSKYRKEIGRRTRENNIARAIELADAHIEGYIEEITGSSFGYARLSANDKDDISTKLSDIRRLIDGSNLPRRKKAALFDRITALQAEVNQDLTSTDRFFAFLGDLAFAVGGMAEKAKPAIEQTKDVLKIVMKSRAKEEQVQLPPGGDLPQLPSPTEE